MTQTNSVDVTRRSPSYESRLSKYAHRGFEVYWPDLDRSKIDPTIFERSFARTMGLARLLVLERLPMPSDREQYLEQRREERGRPASNVYSRRRDLLPGNIKDEDPNDVAEWIYDDEIADYHSFTVPYGPKYHAKRIEKLLYTKDLLLNAEWNAKKDRKVNLHRHPCFIGDVESVMHDCCGFCPRPQTQEEREMADQENKIYVFGDLKFIKDDPGRQTIGSFNPLTEDDWTEMAYVGNTEEFCQKICDADLEKVKEWCTRDDVSLDRRDFTGRTPLHLAIQSSTPEIVACLVDHGARIVARLVDGLTPLHLAAARGEAKMVRTILEKSEANEEEEAEKSAKKEAIAPSIHNEQSPDRELAMDSDGDSDGMEIDEDEASSESESTAMTDGSFVKVQGEQDPNMETIPDDVEKNEPDIYDVNVVAWDTPASPLHFAILGGHLEVIELLISSFGADVLLPIKQFNSYNRNPEMAIMNLVLAAQLTEPTGSAVCKKLISLGASTAQADMDQISVIHYLVAMFKKEALAVSFDADLPAAKAALSHVIVTNPRYPKIDTPLTTAIRLENFELVTQLLDLGAPPVISFEKFASSYLFASENEYGMYHHRDVSEIFREDVVQPVLLAVEFDMPGAVSRLLELGGGVNTVDADAQESINANERDSNTFLNGNSLLDMIDRKISDLGLSEKGALDIPDPDSGAYISSNHEGISSQDGQRVSYDDSTYERWHMSKNSERIANIFNMWNEEKVKKNKEHENRQGLKAKRDTSLKRSFEELRSYVKGQGGKTIQELYPDIPLPEQNQRANVPKQKPFRNSISFRRSHVTDILREGYLQLFEAT